MEESDVISIWGGRHQPSNCKQRERNNNHPDVNKEVYQHLRIHVSADLYFIFVFFSFNLYCIQIVKSRRFGHMLIQLVYTNHNVEKAEKLLSRILISIHYGIKMFLGFDVLLYHHIVAVITASLYRRK